MNLARANRHVQLYNNVNYKLWHFFFPWRADVLKKVLL